MARARAVPREELGAVWVKAARDPATGLCLAGCCLEPFEAMPARGQACGHCLILTEVADAPEGTPLAAGLGAFLAAWRASRGGPPGDRKSVV